MSGVTVAQIRRSISLASTPASASAARAAGSAMSVSASSSVAILRSRMPVRSMIHSSDVSTYCARSSFVTTRSGTFTPSPVIPIRVPLALPITSPLHCERQRAACGQRAVDSCCRLAAADGATDLVYLALERQRLAGGDDALEAAVVDPGEEGDPAAILLLDEHGDGPGLRHRLDDQDTRHHGPFGKVPREPPPVLRDAVRRRDARARL